MTDQLIERIRHICVKSGVPETVMGAICHEVRHAPVPELRTLSGATPRTDAVAAKSAIRAVPADFARQLERELNDALRRCS